MANTSHLTIISHSELLQKAIPTGVSINAVLRRKRALLEGGHERTEAERMAIEAETTQAGRNAKAGVTATDEVSSLLLHEPDADSAAHANA